MTAADIIARYRRYGWSMPEGEWGYIQAQTRRYFRQALDAGDEPLVDAFLRSMFQGPLCMGLVSFDWRKLEEPGGTELFREYVEKALQLWGGPDVGILDAPKVGAPVCLGVNGARVMFDTPRHDHYAQRILTLEPRTVLEIGGGYGGTALQILRRAPDTKIVLVDLPETLYVAGYWLSQAGIDVGWWDDDGPFGVTLVSAGDSVLRGGSPDVVFAAHSLSEMPPGVCVRYMTYIECAWQPRFFYHDGAVSRPPEGANALAAEYPETLDIVPAGYSLIYSEHVPWPLGSRYCEQLYKHD